MLDCKLECLSGTVIHSYTSVISTRKAVQTEITVVYVIMLSVPYRKLASHTKVNCDIIGIGLSR
jgi:hypothetical protein